MSLLLPFFVSGAVALMVIPLTIMLARRIGLVDHPTRHHPAILHRKPIVRAGGIPIFLAVATSAFLFLPPHKHILGILAGGLWVVTIGLLDDRADIHPYLRFIGNLIAAGIVIGVGIGISFITNPLGGIIRLDTISFPIDIFGFHHDLIVADLFTLLWIPWVMNMLNWSKGVDGQMPGIVIIAAIIIALLSIRGTSIEPQQWQSAVLAVSLAGGMLGFLFYNWHPAKIFPGYSATFAGFLLAVLAIFATSKVATAVLVLAVPMIDGGWTILRRIASRRNPFFGDRLHLHHRLIDLGWSHEKIALFYWAGCAILGALALISSGIGKVSVAILVGLIMTGGFIWLHAFLASDGASDRASG